MKNENNVGAGSFSEQSLASYLLPAVGGSEIKQSLLQIVRDSEATSQSKVMAMSVLAEMGGD